MGSGNAQGASPGHSIPAPTLSSGDAAFPHPQFVPKSVPAGTPPQSRGTGAAQQQGWGPGWAPPGRGHTHTQRAGGQPRAGVAQYYLLLQKDFHKFPKPAGIVVPHSFGVAEGFQQGGRLQDLPWRWGEPQGQPGHPDTPQPWAVLPWDPPLVTLPPSLPPPAPCRTPMGAKI